MSIAGTFIWDRLVLLLFGPPPGMPASFKLRCIHALGANPELPTTVASRADTCALFGLHLPTANNIFMAMWREALKTSLMDCLPIFGSLAKVAVGILVLGSGNPLIWGGAWYFNKRRKQMTEEWNNQKRLQELEEKKKQKLGN